MHTQPAHRTFSLLNFCFRCFFSNKTQSSTPETDEVPERYQIHEFQAMEMKTTGKRRREQMTYVMAKT